MTEVEATNPPPQNTPSTEKNTANTEAEEKKSLFSWLCACFKKDTPAATGANPAEQEAEPTKDEAAEDAPKPAEEGEIKTTAET